MRYRWRLTCLAVMVLCAGCSHGSKPVRLQGEVSFDAKPIEKGKIDFLPTEGTTGGAVSAAIVNGRYEFPPQTGLLDTGVYAVRILGLRKTGRTERDRMSPEGPPIEVQENFIPPIYNTESTLKIRVAELPDRNKVDFHLGKKSRRG
jgi:hypothetical protein